MISSAIINVKWASIIVNVISTDSLFLIFSIIFEKIAQVNIQNTIHQKNIDENDKIHSDKTEKSICLLSDKIHKITKKSAIAVQSLKRLSHSNTHINLLGAQTDLKSDNTATVSVADIIAQNNKHTIKGIFIHKNHKLKNIIIAINKTDIINQTMERENTGSEFLSNSL